MNELAENIELEATGFFLDNICSKMVAKYHPSLLEIPDVDFQPDPVHSRWLLMGV